jgi:hypothetical protein
MHVLSQVLQYLGRGYDLGLWTFGAGSAAALVAYLLLYRKIPLVYSLLLAAIIGLLVVPFALGFFAERVFDAQGSIGTIVD